ncbi:MAG: hypothetical protein EA359_04465 [Balneolaceae bacterium]|nr:MAG: hypothetical protein EA359_04465 [Balneolaceae bacterium]
MAELIPQHHLYAQTPAEALEEANHILNDFGGSIKEWNSRIAKTEGYYNQFRECVSGRGDTGRECQQYIDLLYESAGIEAHEAVMEAKMTMEEILSDFESSRAFQMLGDAKKGFSDAAAIIGNAKNVIDFVDQFQKYNPEGARGDPTRGLLLIGEAIGGAAGKLPYPMNKIFEGYAESVKIIAGKLVDLQGKIENARQGNLGGGWSSYANAQAYFERNFEKSGGYATEFFDVTSQFSLLGSNVQVFQNFVSLSMDYFVYDRSFGRERGWIVIREFQTVYRYFDAMPAQYRGAISEGYRAELMVSQARSNPGVFIDQAKQHFRLFSESVRNYIHQRILEEMGLWESMRLLLSDGESSFVGLWLFSSEKHNEIRRISDVLTQYVYAEGTVMRETATGREPASNIPVELDVEDGGFGQSVSDANGAYFVFARGRLDSRFTIRAGQGEDLFEDSGRFYQQGFNNWVLVLKKVERTPVRLTLVPDAVTLAIGESTSFTATAVFEDQTVMDITANPVTFWSSGNNTFTASEAGEFVITVSYMGITADALVTVEEEETEQEIEPPVCDEVTEVWDDELQRCRCNTEEGYEFSEELDRCINIKEAIEEVSEENGYLCDEIAITARLSRLQEIAATGNRISANFQNTLNKFYKEVNDQNSNPCENTIIAVVYAEALQTLADYRFMIDEARQISTELILEGAICAAYDLNIDLSSILQLVSQTGQPVHVMERGIGEMENQFNIFSCNTHDVTDRGDTIAERTDPEIIQAGGTGAFEICGDGIDNDGNGLIDEGCETEGNFNVIIVLYDSGRLPDDVFGLAVSGQGNLGSTPEGGSRTYPLRLPPGSYIATVTVIRAPDNIGTYTIRILENGVEIASMSGAPPQGAVIQVPFVVGQYGFQAVYNSNFSDLRYFDRIIEQDETLENW